jgi:hypothetical protein
MARAQRCITATLAVIACVVTAAGENQPQRAAGARAWPDTTRGVHVFKDQIDEGLNDAQLNFAATHYAGAQKLLRREADRLRAINPGFLVLHYRLGLGIGYRAVTAGCQPTGDWLAIIEGNEWVREWPGDGNVVESWFFHWPAGSTTRVLQCDWGWYLVDPDNVSFRTYWRGEVARQLVANADDGLFLDSASVPNYLGGASYSPALPEVDEAFEQAWSRRIADWLSWLHGQGLGSIVPNVGAWINGRDATDYSAADGLMIEGFALETDESPYGLDDWKLQVNRVLGAVRRGQAILAQTYVTGVKDRMFALGSYLLIKGSRTYLNIETGGTPEWWPEYDVPIGAALALPPASIEELEQAPGLFLRTFDGGLVIVNATNEWDNTGATYDVPLVHPYSLAEPVGGGAIDEYGQPVGSLRYHTVSRVTLGPGSAAILLTNPLGSVARRHVRPGR